MSGFKNFEQIELHTERLILRPFKESDVDDLYEYAKVEGVGEMAGWPHHKSIEESKEILKMLMEPKHNFAIVHKQDNKVIGSLGLKEENEFLEEMKDLKTREIGYVISKAYWGKGYAAEAAKKAIAFAFEKLDIEALIVHHDIENTQSKRVAEKLGFTYVRESIHHSLVLGTETKSRAYILYKY